MKNFILCICCGLIAGLFEYNALAATCTAITDCTVGSRKNLTAEGEILHLENGKCLICDAHIGGEQCAYNTTVLLANGTIFQCQDDNGATDVWHPITPKDCTGNEDPSVFKNEKWGYKFYEIKSYDDIAIRVSSNTKDRAHICKSTLSQEEQLDCEKAKQRGEPANWNGHNCNCGDSHNWNKKTKRCEKRGNLDSSKKCPAGSDPAFITQESCIGKGEFQCTKFATNGVQCICGKCNSKPSTTQNCINSRTSAEGKACCLVPSSVAKWDGQHCICTDSNKTFINGSCVSQQQSTTVTFQCPDADLVQLSAWLEQYASNAQIVALINQILIFCTNNDNRSQTEFYKMMAELRALIAKTQANIAKDNCRSIPGADWVGGKCVCVAAGKVVDESQMKCVDSAETVAARLNAALQKSRNEISSASSKINAIKESFKKTVWKDEDGKFNTTRLASDSIAAVVLGTAGGLITSNVIKKNQVKNGFEDINCTVGGQKVAGWGDEFRVGIQ